MSTATEGPLDKLIVFLATGFGSGYSPKAPGTVGTLVAVVPLIWLQTLPLWLYALFLVLASVIGIYLCHRADQLLQSHDNKAIVWDEFCGFWLTMLAAPEGWLVIVTGFVLFRLFDIIKPWPISWLDKHVKGGLGVMLDDIVAGFLALLCVQIVTYYGLIS